MNKDYIIDTIRQKLQTFADNEFIYSYENNNYIYFEFYSNYLRKNIQLKVNYTVNDNKVFVLSYINSRYDTQEIVRYNELEQLVKYFELVILKNNIEQSKF